MVKTNGNNKTISLVFQDDLNVFDFEKMGNKT